MFEEAAAYYLAIGMPLAEFWNGPPHNVYYYQQAHRYKVQEINQIAWIQGAYIKSALDATVGNLMKKKGAKANRYVEKPFDILPKTRQEKEAEEYENAKKLKAYFDRLIAKQKMRKAAQKSGD